MIDLNSFLAAMKISWIRRLNIDDGPQPLWSCFYPILKKLKHFGENYALFCSSRIENTFWQQVLKHYKKLYQTKQGQNTKPTDLYKEPIHYNKNIKRGNQVIYVKDWETIGLLKIENILDNEGNVMGYLEFKNKFNLTKTNFILYQGITEAIKCYIKDVKQNPTKHNQIYATELWACITAGSKNVKSKLQEDNSLPTAVKKWNQSFKNLQWKFIFRNTMKQSLDTQLKWFQVRLLHRILPTNKYLAICKLTDSSLCSFCNESTESINHLFWHCIHVKKFWEDLISLLQEKCIHCARFSFKEEPILFGHTENTYTDIPMNLIILLAKFYINKCKFEKNIPTIKTFIQQLAHRIRIEERLAHMNNKYSKFKVDWFVYEPLFASQQ